MDDQTIGLLFGLTIGLLGAATGIAVPIMMLRGTFSKTLAVKPEPGVTPASKDVLLQRLLALDDPQQPYHYLPDDRQDLRAEWRIADANWWEFFERNHLEITYRARVYLHEKYREVRIVEEWGRLQWAAGMQGQVPRVSWQKEFFKGVVLFKKSREVAYAFKDELPLDWGKVVDYDFDVWRVKGPILRTAVESGWAFVPCVQEGHLRADRRLAR